MYKDNQYITNGLYWPSILKDFPKDKNNVFRPIFEAFTNSIEAIKDKQKKDINHKGEIIIKIYVTDATAPNTFNFSSISITDNGIGFDNEQFKRFNTFRDNRKSYNNRGAGRVQYVHFFNSIEVKSVFEEKGELFERNFIIFKSQLIEKESFVKHISCIKVDTQKTGTTITFNSLLENNEDYNNLNDQVLKKKLIERYIHYFCYNQDSLPQIEIELYSYDKLKSKSSISKKDIPKLDKEKVIKIQYSKKLGSNAEKTDRTEDFKISSFILDEEILEDNNLKLVSKGEVIEKSEILLDVLEKDSNVIEGKRFLFIVSSNYIDEKNTITRDDVIIPQKTFFLEGESDQEILKEDIQEKVNKSIIEMYPKIKEIKKKLDERVKKLKEMFFLDDEISSDRSKISINDKDDKILEKYYTAEAKKISKLDAKIKKTIDDLENFDIKSVSYNEQLEKAVENLNREIPLSNKNSLAHYVSRRKLILELLDKILSRRLQIQQNDKNFDESLIHNLLFEKKTTNTEDSNLWILNEDFIYFNGNSEKQLDKLEFKGEKIFKEEFKEEERKYLNSLGENRLKKRPDIVLFPEEGKCIIIELKAPNVNISDYLYQINKYASLIRNFTKDNIQFETFFGYLIGESIEARDVRNADSDFKASYHFDYVFRPAKNIVGDGDRKDGSIYTEVLKYSTLLERAKLRNKIFIDKLGLNKDNKKSK